MKTLKFETSINAPAEKVWQILWNDETYRKWTAPFCEGSYAESDWKEGDSVKFLTPSGEGMYSVIEKKIANKQMTFKHLGSIKDGRKTPETEWANSTEEYFLEEKSGKTTLKVSVETVDTFVDSFNKTFKEALEIIKTLSEK